MVPLSVGCLGLGYLMPCSIIDMIHIAYLAPWVTYLELFFVWLDDMTHTLIVRGGGQQIIGRVRRTSHFVRTVFGYHLKPKQ